MFGKLLALMFACCCLTFVLAKGENKQRHLEIFWDKVNCSSSDLYTRNTTCGAHEPDHKTIYTQTSLIRNVNYAKLAIKVFFVKSGVTAKTPLVNWEIDGCSFLIGAQKNRFLKIFHQAVAKYSNLPAKCPLLKDTTYYFNDFTVNASNFPPFIPETGFIAELRILNVASIPIYEIFINGHMKDRNKMKSRN